MSQKTDDRMGYLLLIGVVAFFVAGVALIHYFWQTERADRSCHKLPKGYSGSKYRRGAH